MHELWRTGVELVCRKYVQLINEKLCRQSTKTFRGKLDKAKAQSWRETYDEFTEAEANGDHGLYYDLLQKVLPLKLPPEPTVRICHVKPESPSNGEDR